MEHHGTEEETDQHGAAPHHGDNGNHGSVEAEGVEIGKVGGGEEHRDEDDAPVPTEGGSLLAEREPQEEEHGKHHEELVEGVPRLHGEFVQSHTTVLGRCHQELVVESADGAQHIGEHHEDNPFVVLEIDTFFLAGAREHPESYHGNDDTDPLPHIQPFAKERDAADEHPDGAGGIDGANDGNGQMFQPEVGEEPTAEHDERLEQDVFMFCPPVLMSVEEAVFGDVSLCREDDERQEDERGEQGVECQHRNDRILPERLLLEDVVEAEEGGGKESEN